MTNTIWESGVNMPEFPPLNYDLKTDVLIVGGGMAGVLCAHMLEGMGEDYLLVEAGEPGGGVTRNTTAKITVQHGLIYEKIIQTRGEEAARLYLQANQWAAARYRSLCREIDCDYEEQDSLVYLRRGEGMLEREVQALQRLGAQAELKKDLPLPLQTAGAVCLPGQGQFHPLKFLAAISKGLKICANTRVLQLMPGKAVTDRGDIHAEHIIIATHFPMLNKHGGYFLKLYQHRSYVLALRNVPPVEGMYVDENPDGLSFRSYNGWLLLGGGSHRTGKSGGAWRELETFARQRYADATVAARWATQDCMTLDGIPYIGRYAKDTDGLYVATGFNKWGMSSSMVSAILLSDLLLGRENAAEEVFSPSRSILHPQLAKNVFSSIVGLLTPTAPRCPHLGCALKYNPDEHSWDCPCHGSRFSETGKVIDNPATDDKKGLS